MKSTILATLFAGLAAASSIPKSLIPLPSPVPDTTSFIPLPTPIHSSTPPPYYSRIHDILAEKLSDGVERRSEELEARKEDCWERVDGWCAPYCDGQFPGPDPATKRQACRICIAVQSAFCLA
ncbi:uncharacterized protein CC84DRAFT_1170335 [Paraphaeosphaeria sporulosa]|uniref:Uncharacterized protein n=1 Tax=Paraphaeosphaeria sporulosa TaxID=1460663 RepID=A0A177CV73_9PLEO|nr:uncharacterized protein CC84DRAFT_1170335 [Paraphaeosphaeria sporulosa]OAG11423.1 hypothetical protein CC84DRAFT_1170335 [Paraphaeosphaeria sporulosa]